MNRKKILSTAFVFIFVLVSFGLRAEEPGNNPVAVSPGSDTEAVSIWLSCPTFSWSAVERASSYRVAVFEVVDPKVMEYEDAAAMVSPVISKDIPGPALSWTLPAEESLKTGNMYTWYVQAVDANGNALGKWSKGRIFKVKQEVRFVGVEEKLSEILKSYGVSEVVINNVLKEMDSEMREVSIPDTGTITAANNSNNRSGVKGYEGTSKTYYGLYAGQNNTAGGITFLGYQAGRYNTTGSANTFVGNDAGLYNTTGNYNTFIGYETGYNNSSGIKNTFVGEECGVFNTTGYSNTFLGELAGQRNSIGNENTFIGQQAGFSNTSGYSNTFIGKWAGYSNTTGQGNLFLGHHAGYNETGSNKLYIDNSNTSSPLIYGEFDNDIVTIHGKLGIGTKTPAYQVEVDTTGEDASITAKRTDGATSFMSGTDAYAHFGAVSNHSVRILANNAWKMLIHKNGSLSMSNGATCTIGGVWTNASSRELKENIENLCTAEAMDALNRLNPVKYNYKVDKADKHVGFIAEDVPELVAAADRKGMSPMDVIAVLTKVVQEQQKTIADLQERMAQVENK